MWARRFCWRPRCPSSGSGWPSPAAWGLMLRGAAVEFAETAPGLPGAGHQPGRAFNSRRLPARRPGPQATGVVAAYRKFKRPFHRPCGPPCLCRLAVPALVSARLWLPPCERPALEHRGRPVPWRPAPATPARQRRQPVGSRQAAGRARRARIAPMAGDGQPALLGRLGGWIGAYKKRKSAWSRVCRSICCMSACCCARSLVRRNCAPEMAKGRGLVDPIVLTAEHKVGIHGVGVTTTSAFSVVMRAMSHVGHGAGSCRARCAANQ